ncbi:COP9 signalosome complex subunit 7 isoform X4 [Brassica rapa]|uniref:COP9 signalosome complex subunit 7 isoform X4 n=1 Tax=Brassica campestris TaxID=3711 RepID=UPI0004F16000|nr:COP9 signalosome complex subunit 7 isoform X4 [Brassica rapa]XP_048599169.1 COP9 signalosome complex subunit 7-like isoform X4 [Brassica napus]
MIKSSLMEIEQKQAEIIGQLVDRASKCSGESMWPIYITSFSFRLFQDFGSPQLPSLKEPHILFSSMYYGCLPMAPGVLPYDNLMVELDVTNVRQLEDFLNNECMYDGIVRGKLDQLKRCFEVPFAAGRDPRPGELGDMLHALSNL